MNKEQRKQFVQSFNGKEYRRALANDTSTGLAFQISSLRRRNGWTIQHLAAAAELSVRTVKRMEDPNFDASTLESLKKIADAFDVVLAVRFVPFSDLMNWIDNLTPDTMAPPGFEDEIRPNNNGGVSHWINSKKRQCCSWVRDIFFPQ